MALLLILLAVSTALIVIDWAQTRYIARHPGQFYEINPILGAHPSLARVNAYFVFCIVANAVGCYLLPWHWGAVQVAIIVLEVIVTVNNARIGIKPDW